MGSFVSGFWFLVSGFWFLVSGFWFLVGSLNFCPLWLHWRKYPMKPAINFFVDRAMAFNLSNSGGSM